MTDTNSTAELDKAQNEPESKREEYFKNLRNFVAATFGSGISILVWCILSVLVVYGCKIAQANVLPSDTECYPYTEKISNIEIIDTFIFSNPFFSSPRVAMKLQFPDPHNSYLDPLITGIRNYKNDGSTSYIGQFFNSILETMIAKNFGFYNMFFSFLNSLPEFVLILLAPIIAFIVFMGGMYRNLLYFTLAWFSNLSWLFKRNANVEKCEDGEITYLSPPKWVDVKWSQKQTDIPHTNGWLQYTGRCILCFVFVMIFLTLFIAQGGLLLAMGINVFCGIFLLTYNIKLNGKDSSITSLFPYFFKYNKLLIMGLFSLFAVTNAYTFLGPKYAVFAVLTLVAIYRFKIVEMFVLPKDNTEREVVTMRTNIAKRLCAINDKGETGYKIMGGNNPVAPVVQSTPVVSSIPVVQGTPVPSAPEKIGGGRKSNVKINSSHIMKELEKFNNKYGSYLNKI